MMKLLLQRYRGLQRFLVRGPWFTCGILAIVVAVDILGRYTHSDLFDALSIAILGLAAFSAVVRHGQAPLAWLEVLKQIALGARERVLRWAFQIGIDLRGQPPVPRRVPGTLIAVLGILATWSAVIALVAAFCPSSLRETAIRFSYIAYLLCLAILWLGLCFCAVVAALIPAAMIHDRLVTSHSGGGRRSRQRELFAVGVYFTSIVLAAMAIPAWVAMALTLLAVVFVTLVVVLAPEPGIQFIWAYRGRVVVWSISFGQWVTWQFCLGGLAVLNLALTACGRAFLRGDLSLENMPITTSLGMTLTWLAPGAFWALGGQLALARLRDPSRSCAPVLHIGGSGMAELLPHLKAYFSSRGWKVRSEPAMPEATDVCVELSALTQRPDEIRWPLQVTAAELTSDVLQDRLRRRDEIQQRRRLLAGLERLFKLARKREFGAGCGYWVAPHLWFITALSRDSEEETMDLAEGTILSGTIGPPYHELLPLCARHHAYLVLRALEVDLIFVEDGVGFRRFRRILRMMFELYDIHGGRQRAEEMHFQGVRGTRVVIHDFRLNEPFESSVYPEPDYENLGRARILHIFRDRGEQEELLETPLDDTRVPVTNLMA